MTSAVVVGGAPQRRARWVPWVLVLVELGLCTIVLGALSLILVVQLTLVPGALFSDLDFTTPFDWALTGAIELAGAVIVFAVTMVGTLVIGLPVRLIPPLRRLWLANGEVTIAGIVLGAALILVAYALGGWQRVPLEYGLHRVFVPSLWPLALGWAIFALSLMHVVWPARWLPRRVRGWWGETQTTRKAQRQ